jgi:hypothetical protein
MAHAGDLLAGDAKPNQDQNQNTAALYRGLEDKDFRATVKAKAREVVDLLKTIEDEEEKLKKTAPEKTLHTVVRQEEIKLLEKELETSRWQQNLANIVPPSQAKAEDAEFLKDLEVLRKSPAVIQAQVAVLAFSEASLTEDQDQSRKMAAKAISAEKAALSYGLVQVNQFMDRVLPQLKEHLPANLTKQETAVQNPQTDTQPESSKDIREQPVKTPVLDVSDPAKAAEKAGTDRAFIALTAAARGDKDWRTRAEAALGWGNADDPSNKNLPKYLQVKQVIESLIARNDKLLVKQSLNALAETLGQSQPGSQQQLVVLAREKLAEFTHSKTPEQLRHIANDPDTDQNVARMISIASKRFMSVSQLMAEVADKPVDQVYKEARDETLAQLRLRSATADGAHTSGSPEASAKRSVARSLAERSATGAEEARDAADGAHTKDTLSTLCEKERVPLIRVLDWYDSQKTADDAFVAGISKATLALQAALILIEAKTKQSLNGKGSQTSLASASSRNSIDDHHDQNADIAQKLDQSYGYFANVKDYRFHGSLYAGEFAQFDSRFSALSKQIATSLVVRAKAFELKAKDILEFTNMSLSKDESSMHKTLDQDIAKAASISFAQSEQSIIAANKSFQQMIEVADASYTYSKQTVDVGIKNWGKIAADPVMGAEGRQIGAAIEGAPLTQIAIRPTIERLAAAEALSQLDSSTPPFATARFSQVVEGSIAKLLEEARKSSQVLDRDSFQKIGSRISGMLTKPLPDMTVISTDDGTGGTFGALRQDLSAKIAPARLSLQAERQQIQEDISAVKAVKDQNQGRTPSKEQVLSLVSVVKRIFPGANLSDSLLEGSTNRQEILSHVDTALWQRRNQLDSELEIFQDPLKAALLQMKRGLSGPVNGGTNLAATTGIRAAQFYVSRLKGKEASETIVDTTQFLASHDLGNPQRDGQGLTNTDPNLIRTAYPELGTVTTLAAELGDKAWLSKVKLESDTALNPAKLIAGGIVFLVSRRAAGPFVDKALGGVIDKAASDSVSGILFRDAAMPVIKSTVPAALAVGTSFLIDRASPLSSSSAENVELGLGGVLMSMSAAYMSRLLSQRVISETAAKIAALKTRESIPEVLDFTFKTALNGEERDSTVGALKDRLKNVAGLNLERLATLDPQTPLYVTRAEAGTQINPLIVSRFATDSSHQIIDDILLPSLQDVSASSPSGYVSRVLDKTDFQNGDVGTIKAQLTSKLSLAKMLGAAQTKSEQDLWKYIAWQVTGSSSPAEASVTLRGLKAVFRGSNIDPEFLKLDSVIGENYPLSERTASGAELSSRLRAAMLRNSGGKVTVNEKDLLQAAEFVARDLQKTGDLTRLDVLNWMSRPANLSRLEAQHGEAGRLLQETIFAKDADVNVIQAGAINPNLIRQTPYADPLLVEQTGVRPAFVMPDQTEFGQLTAQRVQAGLVGLGQRAPSERMVLKRLAEEGNGNPTIDKPGGKVRPGNLTLTFGDLANAATRVGVGLDQIMIKEGSDSTKPLSGLSGTALDQPILQDGKFVNRRLSVQTANSIQLRALLGDAAQGPGATNTGLLATLKQLPKEVAGSVRVLGDAPKIFSSGDVLRSPEAARVLATRQRLGTFAVAVGTYPVFLAAQSAVEPNEKLVLIGDENVPMPFALSLQPQSFSDRFVDKISTSPSSLLLSSMMIQPQLNYLSIETATATSKVFGWGLLPNLYLQWSKGAPALSASKQLWDLYQKSQLPLQDSNISTGENPQPNMSNITDAAKKFDLHSPNFTPIDPDSAR